MAEEYLSQDPNAGLEDQYLSTDPNAGLEQPKEEGGVASGVLSAVGSALNPINLVKGALGLGQPSDISQIMRYGKTLGEIVSGTSPDEAIGRNIPELQHEREAFFGKLGAREQAAELTGIGLQTALLAAPFIHGKVLPRAPGSLSEVAGIQPVTPEAIPQTPESLVSEVAAVETKPITEVQPTEEVIPSASEITSPESVTVPEVREEVGGEAPLRQQGETPEARQEIATEEGQVVEPVPQPEQSQEISNEIPIQKTEEPTTIPTEERTVSGSEVPTEEIQTQPELVQSEIEPRPVPTEPTKTGVSSERFTEQYGEDAPVPNTGKSAGQLKQIGVSRLDNFQKTGDVRDDPYSVLTNLREGKVPVSQLADDVSLLRAEHQRLKNEARNAEGTPEWEDKKQSALGMANAIKEVAHGPASDMMRSFQEYDVPRYDNVTDFDMAWQERLGRESTSQERVQFKKMAEDVTNTRNGAEEAINGVQKRLNKMPKMDFAEAAKNIQNQITELTKDCVL